MKKIRMLNSVHGAPDHLNTRLYSKGETYEVRSELMPEWLADAFKTGGARIPDPSFVAPSNDMVLEVPVIETAAAEQV